MNDACSVLEEKLILVFTFLCAIHGATVENTLFEDGDSSNTFRAFNPTQSEETYVFLGFHFFFQDKFYLNFVNFSFLSLNTSKLLMF